MTTTILIILGAVVVGAAVSLATRIWWVSILGAAAVGIAASLVTGHWWLAVGLPLGVTFHMAVGATQSYRDIRRAERLYSRLIRDGRNHLEALLEISQLRHPELTDETHALLITRFPDLYQFMGFMLQAADFGKRKRLNDKEVFALLGSTTLVHEGQGIYTAKIDRKAYDDLMCA